ncbi:hypothetical protein CRYPA_509 [uncultured Candidatus Thioglobus sp.]|nr:hypothetical protein CRYPA_509 [uncultured Candidatus Thioglobus sp.]
MSKTKFKVGDNKFENRLIYTVKTNKGNFTLRNKSASNLTDDTKPRWTIDVNKGALGNKRNLEVKFK